MKIISILVTAIIAFSSISQETKLTRLTDLCEGSCNGVSGLGSYTSNKCYFSGKTPTGGVGLYTSDGTISGTKLIKQVHSDFTYYHNSITEGPVTSKGIFYFGSPTGGLWRSDGSEQGTFELKANIGPENIRELNGAVVFTATDSIHGKELWSSDGTVLGTYLLKDIYPGVKDGIAIIEFNTVLNGKIYFSANDGIHGNECWVTDGTSNGTRMLADLNPGSSDGYFNFPIIFNNEIYFNGSKVEYVNQNTVYTNGVFKTNGGTPTIAIKGIEMNDPVVFQNQLFFAGSYPNDNIANVGTEFYKSTGTGAILVKDINSSKYSTTNIPNSSFPTWLTVINNNIYFRADDGIHGIEPWISDGTSQGTHILKDINPGKDYGCAGSFFRPANNKVYFLGNDPLYGREIMETDGTSEGTKVYDICPGSYGDSPMAMNYNDELFIVASDWVSYGSPQPTYGKELWKIGKGVAGVDELSDKINTLDVFPNPINNQSIIKSSVYLDNATLSVYNTYGQLVTLYENLIGNEFTIHKKDTLIGVYFLKLKEGNKQVGDTKMIVFQ